MSASLVGSEMCIRDRGCAHWWRGRGAGHPLGRGARARRGALWERGSGAVSYTHLTLPTICSV
eukprot:6805689-Alexandrium_andersonii.AAC.1